MDCDKNLKINKTGNLSHIISIIIAITIIFLSSKAVEKYNFFIQQKVAEVRSKKS